MSHPRTTDQVLNFSLYRGSNPGRSSTRREIDEFDSRFSVSMNVSHQLRNMDTVGCPFLFTSATI